MGKKISKKKFRKKCLAVPKKNERGESLVSPGMVCYAEKQVKPFWFSSLDQIVHFGAIIFCRTFVELFWSVRVDRKKRVTIIVAFHFMKRRLKSHYNSRVSLHEAPTKKKSHYNSRVSLHEAPTKKKSHYNSRVSLHEAPTKKTLMEFNKKIQLYKKPVVQTFQLVVICNLMITK